MKDLFNRTCGIYIPSFFSMKIDSLSFGENMNDRELSLPSDIKMTKEQQDIVIEIVKSCF